jgi:hypothetical protein
LSKTARGVILFFIVLIVFGAGGYLFLYPAYQGLVELDEAIAAEEARVVEVNQARADNESLSAELLNLYSQMPRVEAFFYDEGYMTDLNVMQLTERIVRNAGHEIIGRLSVSRISNGRLSLEKYQETVVTPNYDIRSYAFLDGLKNSGVIQGQTGENGQLNLTFQEAVDLLYGQTKPMDSDGNTRELTGEERTAMVDIIRNFLGGQSAGVGVITAQFQIEASYTEYMHFIDYIYSLTQATSVNGINFLGDDGDYSARKVYDVTLNYYIMHKMERMSFGDMEIAANLPTTIFPTIAAEETTIELPDAPVYEDETTATTTTAPEESTEGE